MIPEIVDREAGPMKMCAFGDRWLLHPDLVAKLFCMAQRLPFSIQIISGFRTRDQQEALIKDGKPAAPVDLSNHTTCPSRAADLLPTVATTRVVKATLGEAATICGLRWGGGSPVDPETGIPSDWNHVDLGPRPR